jgi:hypothetical protein
MEVIAQFSSAEFTEKAEAFFKDRHETKVNGLPTVSLLLWLDPVTMNYVWYAVAPKDKLETVVEYSMGKKMLIPAGAVFITFRNEIVGDKTVVKLSEDMPNFVHELYNAEEVLNATVPYFMRDTFGYELGQVKISYLTKT